MLSSLTKIIYKNIFKPVLFSFEPDDVHQKFLEIGNFLGSNSLTKLVVNTWFNFENNMLEQNIADIFFKNPVGLAAGFDKDAHLINILSDVGFGHEEIGTVTYKSYKGNKQPWTKRLLNSKAILVNFGLKNTGVKRISKTIKNYFPNRQFVYGISIGKTNAKYTTTLNAGIKDYIDSLTYLNKKGICDYYTINISCPNMFGGETFTTTDKLEPLLKEISNLKIKQPIFLKMPINLQWEDFKPLCDLAIKYNITGVVIGNLNKNRNDPNIKDKIENSSKGNISGKPTETLSNNLIEKTYKKFGNKLIIIGVGGIFSAEDAYLKIKKGASLVQLITGMIYEGPQLIGEINRGLVKLLKDDGLENISEAVGLEFEK
ncbi:quinone-dependent dihydroorotate dehydrogenase [Patescibacteria group bacterium]